MAGISRSQDRMTKRKSKADPIYRLSRMAERDLGDILDYTADVWGERHANFYLDDMVQCFVRITGCPGQDEHATHFILAFGEWNTEST